MPIFNVQGSKIENPGQKAPPPRRKKKSDPVLEEFPTLIDRRMEALQYAIHEGYNILYDVTFGKRNIIEDDLLTSLTASKKKYRIYVLLITSTPEQIRKQLKKRHAEMLSGPNPYLRAIPPQMVEKFIEDNKDGFDSYREMYKDMKSKHVAGFTFIEIENKPHGSPKVSPKVSPKGSPTKRQSQRSKSAPHSTRKRRSHSLPRSY